MIIAYSNQPSPFPPASTKNIPAHVIKALVMADRRRRETEQKGAAQ